MALAFVALLLDELLFSRMHWEIVTVGSCTGAGGYVLRGSRPDPVAVVAKQRRWHANGNDHENDDARPARTSSEAAPRGP